MTQVFLSHAIEDSPFVERIAADLTASRINVWKAPESIDPGLGWVDSIQEGLKGSSHFILVISPHAVESRWVQLEMSAAIRLERAGRMDILPVMYDPCEMPIFWDAYQYIDLRHDYGDAISTLIKRIITRRPANAPTKRKFSTGRLVMHNDHITVADRPVIPDQLPDITESAVAEVIGEPFQWCVISAGEVLFGRQHVSIGPFRMAKYPVTVAQFDAFIQARDGYYDSRWWQGLNRPRHLGQPQLDWPELPRTAVNWFEAVAFCRWLSDRANEAIRLPTEWEWQHAAQGDDARVYPWGEAFVDGCANTEEAGNMRPVDVTTYDDAASPFGVVDMVGNVWEWCANTYEPPYSTDGSGVERRANRGGSFRGRHAITQVTTRTDRSPLNREDILGFRICASGG